MSYAYCRAALTASINTYVDNLNAIRSEFPSSGELVSRLETLLAQDAGKRLEYSVEHLYEVLRPDSLAVLVQVLTWLTTRHYVDRIYRVVSATGAGVKDFGSVGDIPDVILDDAESGEEIPVTDKNIEVVYRVR